MRVSREVLEDGSPGCCELSKIQLESHLETTQLFLLLLNVPRSLI